MSKVLTKMSYLERFKMALYIIVPTGSIYLTTNTPIGEWVLQKTRYLVYPPEPSAMTKPQIEESRREFIDNYVMNVGVRKRD